MSMDWLRDIWRQFQALPPARRGVLVVTAVGSLAFFFWLSTGAGRAGDRLLFRGLPEDEVAQVVDVLSSERIPYRLDEGGTAIYVPAAQVYEARIRVAAKGLPSGGGGTGFELFDRPGFGVTDFVHRVNYRRALQGELARSIEQLGPVDRARVQIALPERSPFLADRDRTPSASVVVRVRPGQELGDEQVRGIVHLVASAVEQLSPERVSVVDDRGRLLAPSGDGSMLAAAPAGAQRYRKALEEDLARRVESILERTVGPGRVVARVHADLDWTQTESTEERFDPNSQVERSEQRSSESTSEGGFDAAGVPGAASNVPGGGGGPLGGGSGSGSERTTETINYEISKTVSRSVKPVGEIRRLTVAVLVDGQPVEGGEFVPWEEGDLQRFQQLVQQAVGFSEERGDRITIESAPFRSLEIEEEGGFLPPGLLVIGTQLLHYLAMLLGVLLFARWVIRPLGQSLASAGPAPAAASFPMTAADLEAQLASGEAPGQLVAPGGEGASLPERIGDAAGARSEESVKTIRTWLRQS